MEAWGPLKDLWFTFKIKLGGEVNGQLNQHSWFICLKGNLDKYKFREICGRIQLKYDEMSSDVIYLSNVQHLHSSSLAVEKYNCEKGRQ